MEKKFGSSETIGCQPHGSHHKLSISPFCDVALRHGGDSNTKRMEILVGKSELEDQPGRCPNFFETVLKQRDKHIETTMILTALKILTLNAVFNTVIWA